MEQPVFDLLEVVHIASVLANQHALLEDLRGSLNDGASRAYLAALGVLDKLPAWNEVARELADLMSTTQDRLSN